MGFFVRIAFTGALSAVAVLAQAPQNDTLDIYWIDVEGGASTLVVTPARESDTNGCWVASKG